MPFKRINSKSIRLDGADDKVMIPVSADRLKLSFVEGTDAEIAAGTAKDKPFSIAAWIFVEDVTTGRRRRFRRRWFNPQCSRSRHRRQQARISFY